MKSRSGVEVAGTKFDPRISPDRVKRLNSRQLQSYIQRLDSFVSRETQFVPDRQNKPMRGSLMNQYKSLETEYNRRVNTKFDDVKDIFLPSIGLTIGERMRAMIPEKQQFGNRAVNAPYAPPVRLSKNFDSEQGLKRMIQDMKKRLRTDFEMKQLKRSQREFGQMSNIIKRPDLVKDVSDLTPEEFGILWNYTNFATVSSLMYQIQMALLSSKEKPWHASQLEDAIDDARNVIRDIKAARNRKTNTRR